MEISKKKKCRLYLTKWQRRMFQDLTSRKIIKLLEVKDPRWIEIAIGRIECLASYKLPSIGIRIDDWVLYLDNPQINQLREDLGIPTKITDINITAKEIKAGNISFG